MRLNRNSHATSLQTRSIGGGKTSQLGGEFANIDIVAEKGIKGSVTDLDKIIKPNSIDEIVCNNPYNPTIKDPFELFVNKSQGVLKKDGILTINGQPQNGFINKLTIEKLEQAGFEVLEFKVPLKDKYRNLTFGTTGGGNPIDPNTMVSVIIKKK